MDNKLSKHCVQKYIGGVKEDGRTERRHSSFYVGLYGQTWINFIDNSWELVKKLLILSPNKRKYYQRGQRAMSIILSAP